MRKAIFAVALWLALVMQFKMSAEAVSEMESSEKENHFVIMYDVSGSMKDYDHVRNQSGEQAEEREKRLLGMIEYFLSAVPAEKTPYKIAIIPFADNCPYTDILEDNGKNWWEIHNINDQSRDNLKKGLKQLEYNGNYTNIEEALKFCGETLKEMRAGVKDCEQTVLFITDGLLDIPGNEDKNQLERIIESAERVPSIAEDYPADCSFWAIVPSKESLKNDILYGEDGKINEYVGISVPEEQRENIKNAVNCIEEFCNELNSRRPEESPERAGTIPMDWSQDTLSNFRSSYREFFEKVWGTETVVIESADLGNEFSFCVPNGTKEVDITVIPEKESLAQCEEIVEQLADENIRITLDNSLVDFSLESTTDTIIIKIIAPLKGNYHIETDIKENVLYELDFRMYNGVTALLPEEEPEAALGIKKTLNFNFSYSDGSFMPETEQQYIKLHLEEEGMQGNITEISTSASGTAEFEYVPTGIGTHCLIWMLNYDDTERKDYVGVSRFWNWGTITVTVPEVFYEVIASERKEDNLETFLLQPYSEVGGEKINIPAEAVRKYLDDKWKIYFLDEDGSQIGEGRDLILSVDGDAFTFETEIESSEIRSLKLINERNGTTVPIDISAHIDRVRIALIGCIIFIIIIMVFVLIKIFKPKKIFVTIYIPFPPWQKDVDVKRNGEEVTENIEGRRMVVFYSNGVVIAELEGERKEVIYDRNSRCKIDFRGDGL